MKFYIQSNVANSRKSYEIIESEEIFFNKLYEKAITNGLSPNFSLFRLSNGTINVEYNSYPIGKIKLQGRNKWMMVLKNLYDSSHVEGALQDYINAIDDWIAYIKQYLG